MDNVLLSPRELRQLAKGLALSAVQNAITVLQEVLKEREAEQELLSELQALAEQKGYTLAQLGLVSTQSTISHSQDKTKTNKDRPTKPKFKTINLDSQFFYVENDELKLLKTHTMKRALTERGISLISSKELNATQLKQAKMLIEDAKAVATISFNEKVAVWNEYAKANGEEVLEARS